MQRFGKDIDEAAQRIANILTHEERRKQAGTKGVRPRKGNGPTPAQTVEPPDTIVRGSYRVRPGDHKLEPAIKLYHGDYDLSVTVVNEDETTSASQTAPQLQLGVLVQSGGATISSVLFTQPLEFGQETTKSTIFTVPTGGLIAELNIRNSSGFLVVIGFQFKRRLAL